MKINKTITILLLTPLGLWTPAVSAQQITTANTAINCGQVTFRQPIKAEFTLKNSGTQPLIIKDVRSSCGCTTVEYDKEPIASGQTFKVSAVYDAKQMGHFQKQLGIYSNASDEPFMLTIKGVVVEHIKNFKGEYPYTIGMLRADTSEVEFNNVNRGDMPLFKLHLMNDSDQVAEPQLMHLPTYLRGEVTPERIAPGHSGTVTLQLDSRKLRELGLTQTSIYLGMFPGDKVASNKEIPVNIILLPDFGNLTEAQRANAPELRLSKGRIDLGEFNNKKHKSDDLVITNQGKSTLNIRSIQMLTGGLKVSLSKQNIEPGQSAKLKVTATASELRKARSRARILMITNDPSQAKVMIPIIYKL